MPGRIRHLQPTVEDDYQRKQTRTELRASQVDAAVEQRVGHLDTNVAPTVVTGQVVGDQAPIGRMSRSELRRAIVLREVFSPPIALRNEHDPW